MLQFPLIKTFFNILPGLMTIDDAENVHTGALSMNLMSIATIPNIKSMHDTSRAKNYKNLSHSSYSIH